MLNKVLLIIALATLSLCLFALLAQSGVGLDLPKLPVENP